MHTLVYYFGGGSSVQGQNLIIEERERERERESWKIGYISFGVTRSRGVATFRGTNMHRDGDVKWRRRKRREARSFRFNHYDINTWLALVDMELDNWVNFFIRIRRNSIINEIKYPEQLFKGINFSLGWKWFNVVGIWWEAKNLQKAMLEKSALKFYKFHVHLGIDKKMKKVKIYEAWIDEATRR